MRRWIAVVTVVGVLALALAAGGLWAGFSGVFSASQPSSDPTTAPSDLLSDQLQSSDSAKVGTTPAPTQRAGEHQSLSRLSLQQKAGQVVMASVPVTGADPAALTELADLQVGNVFLRGRGYDGVTAVRAVSDSTVAALTGARSSGIRPFLATDQEGGAVQIMKGPGFSQIPAAAQQASLEPDRIRIQAALWGAELVRAGVNVNFAPVLDTVPSRVFAPQNAPIGAFGREYGYAPESVSSAGVAAVLGFADAGVAPTVKHFPGLGRVIANTDSTSGVVDSQTRRDDPYLLPFQDAVAAGVRWVMISNAAYPHIDTRNIAPFSPVVIEQMLRQDLGFEGIVVSDDICDAVQLSPYPLAARGADFITAGGTIALCTNPASLPALVGGIVDRATEDPAFAAKLDQAAAKALEIKAQSGLL